MSTTPTDLRSWSSRLTSPQFDAWYERTCQNPSEWPEAMQVGLRTMLQDAGRGYVIGNAFTEAMAEWMFLNPGI